MKKRGNIRQSVRAQVSLEFLIIVAFAMLMTLPLILIFYQQSETLNTEISTGQIDKVASEIRDAADEVYYLGSPSKKTLTVYMPDVVKNTSISGNNIIFTVKSSSGDYEVVKWSAANLSGVLQNYSGVHHISIQAYDNYVSISD